MDYLDQKFFAMYYLAHRTYLGMNMRFTVCLIASGVFLAGCASSPAIETQPYPTEAPDYSRVADCNSAMSVSTELNAYELWLGAFRCEKNKDVVRATFLLVAGHIRGLTDIAVLDPVSDDDLIKASKLARVFRYGNFGSGDDEILRDMAQTDHLFDELRNWRPSLDETYDPGWSYTISEDTELYQNMFACQREVRITELRKYARLVRNDEYSKASNDLNAPRAAMPGPYTVGTALQAGVEAIMTGKSAVSSDGPLPIEQSPECDFLDEYSR